MPGNQSHLHQSHSNQGHVKHRSQLGLYHKSATSFVLSALLPLHQNKSPRYVQLLGQSVPLVGITTLLLASLLRNELGSLGDFSNVVSSLGWGGNGAHEIFKIGLTLVAVLCLHFALCVIAELRSSANPLNTDEINTLTQSAAGHWVRAAAGLTLLAWVVDIRNTTLAEFSVIFIIHCLGAGLFFISTFSAVNQMNKAIALSGQSTRLLAWIGRGMFCSGMVMGLCVLPFFYFASVAHHADPVLSQLELIALTPDQRITLIKSAFESFPIPAIAEWLMVLSMLVWVSLCSYQVASKKRVL